MKIDKEQLRALVIKGLTAKQLSIDLGVSRQAIEQATHRLGLADRLKASKPPKRVAVSAVYGRPQEEVRELRKNGATKAFREQRHNARNRGIPWELTLFQWWEIWSVSGRWGRRGRETGEWVMGRIGDVGPYAVGNVVICTHSENAKVRVAVHGAFAKSTKIHLDCASRFV